MGAQKTCKCTISAVVDTRETEKGFVRRRRQCTKCFTRYNTGETLLSGEDKFYNRRVRIREINRDFLKAVESVVHTYQAKMDEL